MDAGNPYEAPADRSAGDQSRAAALAASDIRIAVILPRTWELLRRDWPIVLGAVWLPLVANGIVTGVAEAMPAPEYESPGIYDITWFTFQFATWLVPTWLHLGMVHILLNVARGSPAGFGMLIGEGSRLVFSGIIAAVIVGIGVVAGLVFLVVPGVVLAIGWGLFNYAIVDQALHNPIEALKESWRLTDGYRVALFGVYAGTVALGAFATLVTCGVGILVAFPFLCLENAVLYETLRHLRGPRVVADEIEPLFERV